MDKYIGRLLDNRYEILEVIGSGGMAVVYKARCHRLNRLVAIKILKDEYMEDEDFRRRFHSESQAVAMLSHPNIVSVYDVSTSIMADYIVMELIEGISLKQYMEKKGTVNWKETLHFAIQIGKALEHAHSRGIVHRDIKPHNVMVLKNGSVKVMDFGIARMMSKGNTLTKEALGSVHYISPEQAKGGRVDNRSDLYSLGVVMYEMMTGRPPYDGESPVAVAIQHINGGAAMPSTLNPNIPGGLEQIIMKAMAVDPAARYSSASEMLRDMDEFRKDPAMLFDYQTAGVDVIRVQKPEPEKTQEPELVVAGKTTAERVVEKKEGLSQEQSRQRMQRRAEEQRRREAEAAKKRNNVAIIAISACSLVIVIAVVVLLVVLLGKGGGATEKVQVPNLVGKYYDALDLDKYKNFKLKLSDQELYSTEYEPGQIVEQEPKAGTMVSPNSIIELVICLGDGSSTDDTTGPEESTVGELLMVALVNRTEAEARELLDKLKLDLDVTVEKDFSDDIMAGRVIASDPKVGDPLVQGQAVSLTVSRGRQPKMEEYAGKTEDEVRNILMNYDLDLVLHIEPESSKDVEAGKIIRTEPKAGVLLDVGDEVTLVVSSGAEAKVIPNVKGMSVDKAVSIIKGEGFTVYDFESVESTEEKDVVIGFYVKESPSMDLTKPVSVTSTVVLQVSTGAAAETTKEVQIPIPTREELLAEAFMNESEFTDNQGNVSFTLTIRQGTKVYGEFKNLNFSSAPVSVNLKGSGVQLYEILINGKPFQQISVDFTA